MMLDKIKNFFCNDIGIDLGTMNTLIYVAKTGVVLSEPSIVSINTLNNKVVAVGTEAKRMVGRTSRGIKTIRPMKDGVIADAEVADEMLRYFIRLAAGRLKIMQPRVLVAVPSGITDVETRAVLDSTRRAGARDVRLVQEPLAAAIGVGLPVDEPTGSMIVDIGGGTTEVAIISVADIAHSESVKCGGDAMDEAIIQHLKSKHNLLIGERTAEEIKIAIGSAFPLEKPLVKEVSGRNLGQSGSSLPRKVNISCEEIREALQEPIKHICHAVRLTLDSCKPELAADLITNGVLLTGGGSLLRGLDLLLSKETGLAVSVAKDPLRAVVNGTGILLESPEQEVFKHPQAFLGRSNHP